MQDNEVIVSVLCVCYNHANYLHKALDSVLCQKTDFKYEIIIHDDASMDGSQEIIREYERKYPTLIKTILQKENQYSQGNDPFDIAVAVAKGQFIVFLECDDFWISEQKLQKQVDALRTHPECVICVHLTEMFDEKGIDQCKAFPNVQFQEGVLNDEKILTMALDNELFHTTSRLFYKSVYYIANREPYIAKSKIVGDVPFTIAVSQCGAFYYIAEVLTGYRMGSKGSYSERLSRDWRFFCQVRQELREMWLLFGICHPEHQAIAEQRVAYYIKDEIRARLSSGLKDEYKKVHCEPYLSYYRQLSAFDKLKGIIYCYFPKTVRVLKLVWKKLKFWVQNEK